jgi:type VI secretion system protein ImpH
MGVQGRREDPPVSEQLLREPWRFGFFQGTRLLEWIAACGRLSRSAAARFRADDASVGGDVPAGQEAVRFRATASSRFPADEVLAIQSAADMTRNPSALESSGSGAAIAETKRADDPLNRTFPRQMIVGFFGLTGPKGVLPSYFHRLIRRRLRARDSVFRDFLDLFNHRAISLYYRAWVKYRFPIAFERIHRHRGDRALVQRRSKKPLSSRFQHRIVALFFQSWRKQQLRIVSAKNRNHAQDDAFSRSLLALVGLGTQGQRGRHGQVEPVMLDFAGLFAHFPRTAIGLEGILAEHFGLPIKVIQFQGQWLVLEPADRSLLGTSHRSRSFNNKLGGNAVLGEGVWDVESRFRIRIGPLQNPAQFYRFLPVATGDDLMVLQQLVRVYAGPDLEFDVQLVLPQDTSLEVDLGGNQEHCPLLGWNVWLRAGPFETENGDAVFSDEVIGGPLN